MDASKVEEQEILLASLTDTFICYLLPEAFQSKLVDGEVQAYLEDTKLTREMKNEKLIEWVLDNKTAIQEFVNILMNSDENLFTNQRAETNTRTNLKESISCLFHLIDGCSAKLSKEDWNFILDNLYEHKLINEIDNKKCKQEPESHEICLQIFRSIRRRKPDWPHLFIKAVKERCSNIFAIDVQTDIKTENKNQDSETAMPYLMQDIPDQYMEIKSCSSYSSFSTISDYDSSKVKINLQEDKNSTTWNLFLKWGLVDHDNFTSEPQSKSKQTSEALLSNDSYFSDENEDNKEQETSQLTLRKYQEELAEQALKGRNTIICAPTGSGKTRVATYIILDHLKGRKANEPKRKVAFFARTVPLVMQQYKSLKKYLPKPFEVTHLTGDSEDSMHLHMIMPDNDVIVMTPRILENHFKRKCLPHLGVFSMLIFDECHHTRKGEPYNSLMYSYLKTKKNNPEIKLPQIIGLTASISVEKAKQDDEAVQCILSICGNLDAESISTVVKNEQELKTIVPVPEEEMKKLRERENDKTVQQIFKVMMKLEDKLAFYVNAIGRFELKNTVSKIPTDKKSQQYGQWAVQVKNMAKSLPRQEVNETNLLVRYIIIIADYLAVYNVALETHDLVQLRDVIDYLERSFDKYRQNEKRTTGEETFYNLFCGIKELLEKRKDDLNPNLCILQETLKESLIDKGEKSCGIIFVRTRALTEALSSWLNRCDDESLRKLKATVFTGTAATVDQGGMTQSEQEEIIQRFRRGEVRLLIATSVGEEGLDIPECNLVIKYNHVGNEVTTVQTRGRSRKNGGKSILLAMEKVFRKERINQEKAKMMTRAIKTVSEMKRSTIRKENKRNQEQILKEEDIKEMVKLQEESMLEIKEFHMVCHLCRKLVISSENIRTILETHRVVVNRDILKSIKVKPYKNAKYFDDAQLIGSVQCMAQPEDGKHCRNKLGSMMIFSKVPFIVLSIKSFGFDTGNKLGLEYYNQWKKVPYLINSIEPEDIKSYFPEKIVETNPNADKTDSESDSDDDSKGNRPSMGNSHNMTLQKYLQRDESKVLLQNVLSSSLNRAMNDFSKFSTISATRIHVSSESEIGPVLISPDNSSQSSREASAIGDKNYLLSSEKNRNDNHFNFRKDQATGPLPVQSVIFDGLIQSREQGFDLRFVQRSMDSESEQSSDLRPVQRSIDSSCEQSPDSRPIQRSMDSNSEQSPDSRPVQKSIDSSCEQVCDLKNMQRSIDSSSEQSSDSRPVQSTHGILQAENFSTDSENEETQPKRPPESNNQGIQDTDDTLPKRGQDFLSKYL
ncbi:Antiviral innate immune response receptor RIG-I [Bulinus truncatus]|nr:Antiviral innate immune response receptor RIG-I [Bulinus truncatus]